MDIVVRLLHLVIILLWGGYVITYLSQLNRYEFVAGLKACISKLHWIFLINIVIDFGLVINFFVDLSLTIYILLNIVLIIARLYICIISINKLVRKNKLKFTARVMRFFTIFACVAIVNCICVDYIYFVPLVYMIVSYLVAYTLSKVFEYLYSFKFIYATKKKLTKYKNLIVIGITGSYGKTSTKFILTQILQQKYVTKCTPNSYNTSMGICKYILNEDLNNVEYLIIEMGAVRKNDIKKLCSLVNPSIGIITSIGPQHIETFKTIKNVIKTKMQLADYVSKHNGCIIYNKNNEYLRDVFNKYNVSGCVDVCVYSVIVYDNNMYNSVTNYTNGVTYIYIDSIDKNGVKFKYFNIHTNKYVYLSTMLLGESNVVNIGLCVTLAIRLGLSEKQIIEAVKSLTFVTNRLEFRKGVRGCNIIYDAYNSNKDSFLEMLNVAKNFNDVKYKILITPGVVELGKDQYKVNYELAKASSKIFDEIWVINNVNKYAFSSALVNEKCKVEYYSNLDKSVFDKVDNLDDSYLVIFENDLPDSYN